jgi:ADP-ribosylglycohydrolase
VGLPGCALVGALAGALHGASGIPGDWLSNLENETPSVDEILRLADRLGATRAA